MERYDISIQNNNFNVLKLVQKYKTKTHTTQSKMSRFWIGHSFQRCRLMFYIKYGQ